MDVGILAATAPATDAESQRARCRDGVVDHDARCDDGPVALRFR